MITLLILDGFGLAKKNDGNAISSQTTPFLDKLNKYPYTELNASGEFVGLPKGQMGNSEVGHLNLGAGKIVFQDLPKINNSIEDTSFFSNKSLLNTIEHVKKYNSCLHLMGLLSDGGVHSHINHLKSLIDMAFNNGVKNIQIHVITDGRDTPKNSGLNYVSQLEEYIKGKAKIATIIGRIYAMDREQRWDRIEKAYDMYALGHAENYSYSPKQAMEDSYNEGIYDEFIEPVIISGAKSIESDDGIIFFNYRADRAREITKSFTDKEFSYFKRKNINNLNFCCMTEYSKDIRNVNIAFPPEIIVNNLSSIISENGLKQFHISETTKYAHVTFFFNGGIEEPYKNEERKLIESENVKNYAVVPNMKAFEITEQVLNAIADGKYGFILVNLSNADMIGHTGEMEPAKKAVACVDKCAYAIALASLMAGGDCIITADHGNIEEMIDKNGNACTQHTTNKVPFWLVSDKYKNSKLIKNGSLCNVAPTILQLLNINIPNYMEKSLIK